MRVFVALVRKGCQNRAFWLARHARGPPFWEPKYRPFLEPIASLDSDFRVTGMGWLGWAGLGWLAGWLGWLAGFVASGLSLFCK